MSDADHSGHQPHINRKEYWIIFVWLFVLTILEVGVVYVPGISTPLLVSALVLMAIVKAGLVGWFYMHLSHDTPIMRWTVVVPALMCILYAFVLIAEAAWRML